MRALFGYLMLLAVVFQGTALADDPKKLRLITWADYAPAKCWRSSSRRPASRWR